MPEDASNDSDLPQALIAKILEAEVRGDAIDRQAFFKQQAKHADVLREFFARRDALKGGVPPEDARLPPAPPTEYASPPPHSASVIVDATLVPQSAAESTALLPAGPLTNSLGKIACILSLFSIPFWLTPIAYIVLFGYIFGEDQKSPAAFYMGMLGAVVSILVFLCAGLLSLLGLVLGMAGLRDQPRLAARFGIITALTFPVAYFLLIACSKTPNPSCALIRGGWIVAQLVLVYWIVHRLYFHRRDTAGLRSNLLFIVPAQLAILMLASAVPERFQLGQSYVHLCLYAVVVHWLAIAFVCTEEHSSCRKWIKIVMRWGLLLGLVLAVTDAMIWHFTALKP